MACDLLTLNNGNVTYSNDNRGEGAMAFYDCCPGYTLTGSQSRSCEGVISGGSSSVQWTNSQSSCVGKYSKTLEMLAFLLITLELFKALGQGRPTVGCNKGWPANTYRSTTNILCYWEIVTHNLTWVYYIESGLLVGTTIDDWFHYSCMYVL